MVIDFFNWFENRETRNIIKANDPVREAVSGIETYWDKPGQALNQISEVLMQYGYQIDDVPSFNDNLPEYRATYHLALAPDPATPMDYKGQVENVLVFSWYKMQSGRYEITTYIS